MPSSVMDHMPRNTSGERNKGSMWTKRRPHKGAHHHGHLVQAGLPVEQHVVAVHQVPLHLHKCTLRMSGRC